MLKVQKHRCKTCIYRKDSPLNLQQLEDQVKDKYVGFNKYRACHHATKGNVCCKGFWDHHKDEFPTGQITQHLNMVEFVTVDDL